MNFKSSQVKEGTHTSSPLIWNSYVPPNINAHTLKTLDIAFWTAIKPHLSKVTSFRTFYEAFCKVGAGGMKFEPWRQWLLKIALVLAKDAGRKVNVQRFVIEEAAVAYATYMGKSVREDYIEIREFNRKSIVNGVGQPRHLKYYLPLQVASGPRSCGDVSKWVPIVYGDDFSGGLGSMPFLPSPPTHRPVIQARERSRVALPS